MLLYMIIETILLAILMVYLIFSTQKDYQAGKRNKSVTLVSYIIFGLLLLAQGMKFFWLIGI